MQGGYLRIINWNVRWASPNSARGALLSQVIFSRNPDIVCITEGHKDFFREGYPIFSDADYGYNSAPYKRKVILWSKIPWKDVDYVGDETLPTGRFVCGTTITSIGEIRCIGVCIPWRNAHVSTGRKDKKQWEDHVEYLKGLKSILHREKNSPLVLVGDFNQKVPRNRQSIRIYEQLLDSIPDSLNLATTGELPKLNQQVIDHVAHTRDLLAHNILCIDKYHPDYPDNKPISDHSGVIVDFKEVE